MSRVSSLSSAFSFNQIFLHLLNQIGALNWFSQIVITASIASFIYIVRHPLDRIVSHWRHYRGRNPNCPDFNLLLKSGNLRRLIVGCSQYHRHLTSYRNHFPEEQIHCMTFEDLLGKPQRTLRQLFRFLEVKPMLKTVLDSGLILPQENEAGAKGRGHVEKPEWNPKLRRRVLRIIRPDAKKMLAYMGKRSDYWVL